MLICHFLWLKDEDLECFTANTVDADKIKGIRKFHQVITKHQQCNGTFAREYSCLCNACIKGRAESSHAAESNQHFSVELLKAK